MKRKLVVATLLCLALVAMMAMVAAPSALAKAEILPFQGTETAGSVRRRSRSDRSRGTRERWGHLL